MGFGVESRIRFLLIVTILLVSLNFVLKIAGVSLVKPALKGGLFPQRGQSEGVVFCGVFVLLSISNLTSLVVFSYPMTTTLSFNLGVALTLWLSSILFYTVKSKASSTVLPKNTP